MMQQYLQVKERCKECILFFRLGDFYEMFFEDAEVASRELELVLTGRDCGLEQRAPMCGIPYHAANNYIARLVSKGYKVAICEQLEDPSVAKGIVKRDVIKIITPGTFLDSSFLEENKNNYIMSIYINTTGNQCGLCFSDISTGEFYATNFKTDINIILDEISKYSPKEIIIQETIEANILKAINERFSISYTKKFDNYYTEEASNNIQKQFIDFDFSNIDETIIFAAQGILNYILETQKITLSNVNNFDYYNVSDFMSIDINSRRNLELIENIRDKSKKGSLLWIIDKTSTAMGSRMIRKWVEQPLLDIKKIKDRLDTVEELMNKLSLQEDLRDSLKNVYDIERIIGKISSKGVNAKELISLKISIGRIPSIKEIIKDSESPILKDIYSNIDELKDIYELLDSAIIEAPSLSIKDGDIIKTGYNEEVDELRQAKAHGKEWIATLENNEKEVTGIKSLKVGYNKVFGYYIEISKANYSAIPEGRYIRKQTLANAERFITQDLKEMEDKILGAEEKLVNLEYNLFVNIRDEIEQHVDRMKKSAALISVLDCLCSLAYISLENNYVKPIINTKGFIQIEEGRHPVVEKMISTGGFISNNTNINNTDEQLILITGPNMAGKSTYMRQVALITILAQIGSFVPAKKADISICDKIFTRIGASDDLSSGKSTFMVEMWEVANILNNATRNSLILLDEVGRGTSTYDGLSIAWAVIEYICQNHNIKCKTLFATHYHELTKLEGIIAGVKNYCVSVKEIGKDIVFLRKIIRGGADQSYGIEVAKLAGLPEKLIERAKELLTSLENTNKQDALKESAITETSRNTKKVNNINQNKANTAKANMVQLGLSDLEKEAFINEIVNIDIMNLTPMDSMNKLYDIIKKAKSF
jgi:DNA mismatch repair protein MutS